MNSNNLVLFGDSILDNAPYTDPEPDTTALLKALLPKWSVRCLAQDGATMSAVRHQLQDVGERASVAVLSAGGNDVVKHLGILDRRNTTSADLLEELLRIADNFEQSYEPVARSVAARAARTILCTIYDVQLDPPEEAQRVRVPLAILNDRIIRVAGRLNLEVLELRSICTDPQDFVMQIEPSAQGAAKLARAISDLVQDDGKLRSARVFSA